MQTQQRLAGCDGVAVLDEPLHDLAPVAGGDRDAVAQAADAADLDTGLIAREGDTLMPPPMPSDEALADAAAALADAGPFAGFRLNAAPRRDAVFLLDGEPVTIDFAEAEGDATTGDTALLVSEGGQTWELSHWRAIGAAAGGAADGAILSPMPGRIIAVAVAAGEAVTKGQKLLTLEAMKMEHSLVAPFDGIVADLAASEGAQVTEGATLARIERSE